MIHASITSALNSLNGVIAYATKEVRKGEGEKSVNETLNSLNGVIAYATKRQHLLNICRGLALNSLNGVIAYATYDARRCQSKSK